MDQANSTAATKVAIVSGATFGIGRAIAFTLADRGFRVVGFGLESPQPASIAANGIADIRREAAERKLPIDMLEADVSSPADVERVVAFAIEKHGRVDALVNNAAIGPLGTVVDTDDALWERIIGVNLKGPFLTSRAVIPHMRRQGGGSIVNVGSGAGWGKPNMAAYCASKGGLHALSSAMAYDHFRDRIRINTVIPGGGGIVTGMSLGRANGNVEKAASNGPGTAAGRHGTPQDLANAVAFLLSPEAEVISGTVLDVGCFALQGGPIPPRPAA
jgi:NAD(P)-dependent dehydrogenase (short-subunit alcohol dehydrogenase family)